MGCKVGGLPPAEGADLREAEGADEVFDAVWHNGNGGGKFAATHLRSDGAEGWAVEVVHMRVGEQDRVDRRKLADAQAGMALTAEEEQAFGEDGVDEDSAAAGLDEEGGVSDEGDGGVVRGNGGWEMDFPEQRLGVAFADEAPELS